MIDQTSINSKESENFNDSDSNFIPVPPQTGEVTQPVHVIVEQPVNQRQPETMPTDQLADMYKYSDRLGPLKPPIQPTLQDQDTMKIVITAPHSELYPTESSKQTGLSEKEADLPEWLVRFASQDAPAPSVFSPVDQTQEVFLVQPIAAALTEDDTPLPSTEDIELHLSSESGWSPEKTESDQPALTSAQDGWQTERPEKLISLANPTEEEIKLSSKELPADPQGSFQKVTPVIPVIPMDAPDSMNADDPILNEFEQELDKGQFRNAASFIRQHADEPEIRPGAIRSLRKHLKLNGENQILWEVYAELNAKDNQSELAAKAQEVASQINLNYGGSDGTITGLG